MSPKSDAVDAILWLLLGAAVLVASFTMDRLESQDVPPFAAPGLLPGLLGLGLLLLGGVLLSRSLNGRGSAAPAAVADRPRSRAALVIVLCVVFGTILVGHGVPFWLAAAVFVTAAILLLQPSVTRRSTARSVAVAAAVGLGAGGAVTFVFQQVFLVRLP